MFVIPGHSYRAFLRDRNEAGIHNHRREYGFRASATAGMSRP